jgi:hypothetical protein
VIRQRFKPMCWLTAYCCTTRTTCSGAAGMPNEVVAAADRLRAVNPDHTLVTLLMEKAQTLGAGADPTAERVLTAPIPAREPHQSERPGVGAQRSRGGGGAP